MNALSHKSFQNTRETYAVCVYAGTQTKISLNSKITKNKFSSIERSLNKYDPNIYVTIVTLPKYIPGT